LLLVNIRLNARRADVSDQATELDFEPRSIGTRHAFEDRGEQYGFGPFIARVSSRALTRHGDPAIGRPVNIIVHTLDHVNQGLTRGEYFWIDIARDGIALYELPGVALAMPRPLTAVGAHRMASNYRADWLGKVNDAIEIADFCVQKGKLNDASFTLHQAAERAYICYLLVRSQYVPRSHNLKFLRSLAEDKEPRLIDCWPRATKLDRRRFELAKRAYLEARYSKSYEISTEDIEAIGAAVSNLRDTVDAVSRAWLDELHQKADQ